MSINKKNGEKKEAFGSSNCHTTHWSIRIHWLRSNQELHNITTKIWSGDMVDSCLFTKFGVNSHDSLWENSFYGRRQIPHHCWSSQAELKFRKLPFSPLISLLTWSEWFFCADPWQNAPLLGADCSNQHKIGGNSLLTHMLHQHIIIATWTWLLAIGSGEVEQYWPIKVAEGEILWRPYIWLLSCV